MIDTQFSWTNECFKQALIETYGHQLSEEDKALSCVELSRIIANENDIGRFKTGKGWPAPVNEAYLRNIRQLPTEQIELIVEAYNKGKFNRSPLTIDVLLSELMERVIENQTRSI